MKKRKLQLVSSRGGVSKEITVNPVQFAIGRARKLHAELETNEDVAARIGMKTRAGLNYWVRKGTFTPPPVLKLAQLADMPVEALIDLKAFQAWLERLGVAVEGEEEQ